VLLRSFGSELEGPYPHVVLEHLEGPRLSTMVRRYGPLQPEQVVQLGLQLLSAAHYLAGEGVVHLDIKPSNTIMGGPPRLIDLSVARSFEQCERITSPVGTDSYMAPEQCTPGEGHPIGPAADVWGIGATLYRAAGERAFSKGDPESEVPEERWPQLVEPAADLSRRVDPELENALHSCLALDPADRPSPGELADRLEAVLDRLPRMRIAKLKPRPIGAQGA
jgi:serine/threonine protein kinase